MPDNLIDVECKVCHTKWQESVEQLKQAQGEIYKAASPEVSYRVTCPRCGTIWIITLGEEDEHG